MFSCSVAAAARRAIFSRKFLLRQPISLLLTPSALGTARSASTSSGGWTSKDHSAEVSIDGKRVSKQTKEEIAYRALLKKAAELASDKDSEDAEGPDESYSDEDLASNDRLLEIFESWMVKHNKSYASSAEKLERFEIFKERLKFIEYRNRELRRSNAGFWLGINHFCDWTSDEIRKLHI